MLTPAVKNVLLHVVTTFLVTFGGLLTTTKLGDASASTVAAVVSSAAVAAVIAAVHYLSGLIPNSTVVAESRALKAAKKNPSNQSSGTWGQPVVVTNVDNGTPT